jgi:chromosome segregation ATPase
MAEFKPIETQEDLDAFAGKIRKEATDRIEKKYADYESLKSENAELTEKLSAAEKTVQDNAEKFKDYEKNMKDFEEAKKKVHKYEIDSVKTKVALEAGLPYEAADRLRGETEKDIRADAENFAGLVGSQAQPLADPEPGVPKETTAKAAMRRMLHEINGGNE